jgi:hypothetical protein
MSATNALAWRVGTLHPLGSFAAGVATVRFVALYLA